MKAADGSGAEELVVNRNYHGHVTSWSPDGKFLIFEERHPVTGFDIWILPLSDRKPRAFLQSPFFERHGVISSDGRWLAYTSNESGRNEVYVTPLPKGGATWQVSSEGGDWPIWAKSGRELFYRNGSKFMAVNILKGEVFRAGAPRLLFETQDQGEIGSTSYNISPFDVSPDGRAFVVVRSEHEVGGSDIQVVLNWFDDVRRRVAAGKR